MLKRVLLTCATVLAMAMPIAAQEDDRFIEKAEIDTFIGTLTFEKGFATGDTAETLFRFRTLYRTAEVIQQNAFAASLAAMRHGYEEFGAGEPHQVIVWKNLMDAESEFLTANNNTVYAMTFLDLKEWGPTVIDAPPKLLGLVDDMWMRYLVDIGFAGPDKGEGGKYLFLPPGYEGEVPEEGYFIVPSKTYGAWVLLRAFQSADGSTDDANALYEQMKIYPYSEANNPRPIELQDGTGERILTVHAEDYRLIEELGELVADEHPDALDGAQKFLLASIGIEFGKPFDPDPETKAVLEEGATVGAALLRTNMWDFQNDQRYVYGKWWNPFVGGVYTFDPNGYFDFDAQAYFAAYATGVTPAMATTAVGVGSQYLCTHTDVDGMPLDGAETYRLTVPADVPAKDFWSVVIYDSATRSMMHTSQKYPALSSYDSLEKNADGSVDLYFGPKAPAGNESNWIETDPAKGWSAIFRAYGPLEPFFDQSWKLNDIELVED